jgi:hypothetical protein
MSENKPIENNFLFKSTLLRNIKTIKEQLNTVPRRRTSFMIAGKKVSFDLNPEIQREFTRVCEDLELLDRRNAPGKVLEAFICLFVDLYKIEPKQTQITLNYNKTNVINKIKLTNTEQFDLLNVKQELSTVVFGLEKALTREKLPLSHIDTLKKKYRLILPNANYFATATRDSELAVLLESAEKVLAREALLHGEEIKVK